MPALPNDLRNKLERAIIDARDVAEAGAQAALEALAVHHYEAYRHQNPDQRKLRVQLRAHAKQLGDIKDDKDRYPSIGHLVRECAYEHWHRMLFARFLAENDLLIEPDSGVAISLAEAEELAKSAKVDLWTYASRCAQQMLPQVFRPDDPLLQVGLANEHRVKLERLLGGLDAATFKADDSLGWVYQFWQSAEKDKVNASGDKITGDTLPAVTQLFTEHYMVLFLLHNTIGAWHAGKVLAANPKLAETAASEEVLRQAIALKTGGGYSFDYLRFVRGADGKGGAWRPAAGTFAGWPSTAALLKMLDPCCGSGHFLAAGFELLIRLRMAEEGLDLAHAVDAVLADNVFGLELDARCTQIAAFNLALAAWKLTGYRRLPPMHIACAGVGPQASLEQWLKLVDDAHQRRRIPSLAREPIKAGLQNLHELFSKASTLGSLIDPTQLPGNLIAADYETLLPVLTDALAAEGDDAETRERVVAAQSMVKAVELLAGEYTLVITNVPYLGRGKQDDTLKAHLEEHYPEGKADLAIAFIFRCLDFCTEGGSTSLVTPQNWLFLPAYTHARTKLLRETQLNVVVRLGANAFRDMNFWAATTALNVITSSPRNPAHMVLGVDASASKEHAYKEEALSSGSDDVLAMFEQQTQLENPDARISMEAATAHDRLGVLALTPQGTKTGDDSCLRRNWWEVANLGDRWRLLHGAPDTTCQVDGASYAIDFQHGEGAFARPQGQAAWGKQGVVVKLMGEITTAAYLGEIYDSNVTAVVPKNRSHLAAIWSFVASAQFKESLRAIEQAVKVNNATVSKVPFDLAHWQSVAAEQYPNGLPEPESDDPTQWLFHGRPEASTAPLQVAVARLLGYRWPAELDGKMRLSKRARALVAKAASLTKCADDDGIVCIPSVRGEEPAADRLLALLAACGVKPDRNLDEWLRDNFFQEHCELFHQRPFVWHIWDGRTRDGFHALVNYHKLAAPKTGRKLLESLTYSYLGEWINRHKDGVKTGKDGAEDRLAAATELQKRLVAILEGEPPFDLFVRWKPLTEQPLGWEPDINDGVRMNIRPFLADDIPGAKKGAGILRAKPHIKWDKDRGSEPDRKKAEFPWFWGWDERTVDFLGGKTFKGERFNACHYTNKAKRAARETGKDKR